MSILTRRDFTNFKKLTPITSIISKGGKKRIIYDLHDDNGQITKQEKEDYMLNINGEFIDKSGQLYPYIKKLSRETGERGERLVFYITGSSGSGKTRFSAEMLKLYKKENPKNKVIWISPKHDSEIIASYNPIIINITDPDKVITNFIGENKIVIDDDWENSIVIIDDLEDLVLDDVKLTKQVLHTINNEIINRILHTGRHSNISLMYIKHMATDGWATRSILNESDYIVAFPRKASKQKLDYLLKKYLQLSPSKFNHIVSCGTEYYVHYNRYPYYGLTNREIIFN